MTPLSPFQGVITALVTPFDHSGKIDLHAFEKLILQQKAAGIHGVVILGSTGESPTLLPEEGEALVYEALAHQTPTFRVYVGSGSSSTAFTCERTKKLISLENKGQQVAGVMVVVPPYNKPTPAHLVKHFTEICQSFPLINFCLYNVPGRTGSNLPPHAFAQIASQCPNVVALKEACGVPTVFTEHILALEQKGVNRKINLLTGDDATFVPSLLAGADGVISVASHLIPQKFLEIWKALQAQDFALLKRLHKETYSLNSGLFRVPNPVGVKYLLAKQGLCKAYVRPPLYEVTAEEGQGLSSLLQERTA